MEIIGIPGNFQGLGLAGLFLFLLWMIATGRLLFRWQVDRLFKDKDSIIERQNKIIDDVVPPVTKLLEKLNEKAERAERDG